MEIMQALINSGIVSGASAFFYGAGLVGMILHYLKKRVKGQTKVDIHHYFGKNNPVSSFAAFATYAASMSGMIMGMDITHLSTSIVVVLGITCGWTIDSSINSVKEPE